MASPQPIAVVGAGVVGLTAACILQAAGHAVTVIARATPDFYAEDDPFYASPKAGSHWRSVAIDDRNLQALDADAFRVFAMLESRCPGAGVMRVRATDLHEPDSPEPRAPWYMPLVASFEFCDSDRLPQGVAHAFTYDTYTFDTPHYLAWLLRTFQRLGGALVRAELRHLDEFNKYVPRASLVVNATGLGARTLGGVEDSQVYPTRGQTLMVHAPHALTTTWARIGKTRLDYVIPRVSGLVVLGGTFEGDRWEMRAELETTQRILNSTKLLCPQLATAPLVSQRVGLRPTRHGGPRIEREPRLGYTVVHAYGHGGFGYQSSWGTARRVLDLVGGGAADYDAFVARVVAAGHADPPVTSVCNKERACRHQPHARL